MTRRNTIWHIEIEPRAAVEAPIKAAFKAFDRHKETLLDILRDAHDHGTKSKSRLKPQSFDADKSWDDLTGLARHYFKALYIWRPKMKQETTAPHRRKRLHSLANALGRARGLADKAMRDEVGSDLFKAWFEGTGITLASVLKDGASTMHIANEMKKVVESLATLEAAACRAALDVQTKRGVRKGSSVLPPDCINGLARVYRKSTGLKPRAGEGPFGKFVHEFLNAISGGGKVSDLEYVVEMIKEARTQVRKNPGMWGPSHFDD